MYLLDERLNWIDYKKIIENKAAENLGPICEARYFLNKNTLINIYHCFIMLLNFKWKKLLQKRAVCTIFGEDRLTHNKYVLLERIEHEYLLCSSHVANGCFFDF